MGELLALEDAKAVGARVVEGIERELAKRNIGHLPPRIPRNGTCRVLFYTQDRPGLGLVLHLARQLAEDETVSGGTVDE